MANANMAGHFAQLLPLGEEKAYKNTGSDDSNANNPEDVFEYPRPNLVGTFAVIIKIEADSVLQPVPVIERRSGKQKQHRGDCRQDLQD